MKSRLSDVSFDDYRLADPRPSPEDALIQAEEAQEDAVSDSFEEALERVLTQLSPEDADIADLYWLRGRTQSDICGLFGLGQGVLSYRVAKIRRKVAWLDGPRRMFTCDELLAALVDVGVRHPERVVSYWMTTSYTEAARRHRLSYQTIKVNVSRAINRLLAASPDYGRFALALDACRTVGHGLGTQFTTGPRRPVSRLSSEPSEPARRPGQSPAFAPG